MDRNFAEALKLVLKHEGGWSDHPKDPGGATMRGITLATFRRYIDPKATKGDLRNITPAQLTDIYRRQYWNVVGAEDLPDGVDYAVFDFAVNSGPSRAARYLQSVVGVRQDGKIGPQTLEVVQAAVPSAVINDLCDRRMAFLKGLKTWPTFRKGWTSRATEVRAKALQMAADHRPAAQSSQSADHPLRHQSKLSIQDSALNDQMLRPVPSRPSAPPAHSLQETQSRPGWLSLLLSMFISKGA